MKTKIIALLLAFIFIFSCGCSNSSDDIDNEQGESELLAPGEVNPVLFTANGSEVTEELFKYFVYYYKTELESVYGEITDWDAELQDGMTYWEYVKHMATEWFLYAGAVRAQIIRLGIEITEEDEAIIQQYWNTFCETHGGEEAAIAELDATYCSEAMYKYIVETNLLTEKCFEHMYGENGAKLSDEDCADKTADQGYIMAKHILISTKTTDDAGNTVEMTESEKAEAYKQANSIIVQLNQCAPDKVEARFDEIMYSFTDDPGISSYPNGYLFQEGDMMEEFYNAAIGLEIGKYSSIVETSAGYHIILRIPVNYDVVPISYSSYIESGYDYYTLRYIVAEEMFQANIETWVDRVEVTYEAAYETVTLDKLLARG